MKKMKTLSLLTFPLILTGTGIAFSKIGNNNQDIILQNKTKETSELIMNGHVKDFALGDYFSSIVIEDSFGNDYLYTWGNNGDGQIGNGGVDGYYDTPQLISYFPVGTEIKNIETGASMMGAVVTDSMGFDHLYTWGNNYYGQIGDGTKVDKNTPTEANFPTNGKIKDLSFGSTHSAAIFTDSIGKDHLYTWGYNYNGQLGNGSNGSSTPITNPTEIKTLPSYAALKNVEAAMNGTGIVITDDSGNDSLYMWGSNGFGQLGFNSATSTFATPNLVSLLPTGKIDNFSLGRYHSAAVVTDELGSDSLYMWGRDDQGQLGTDSTSDISRKPILVSPTTSLYHITDLSLNQDTSSVVVEDLNGNNSLYTWGDNVSGQLGTGDEMDLDLPYKVTQLPSESKYHVENGYEHVGVVATNINNNQDSFYMWGDNGSGQLGRGGTNNSNYPVEIEVMDSSVLVSTRFVEMVSKDEFIFEINSPVELEFENGVKVYNSDGIEVGIATLDEGDVVASADTFTYTYSVEIIDHEAASNTLLYWSINDGETLNLISENTYSFLPSNSKMILYSVIGVIAIILLILIIVLIFLFKNKKEKDNDSNKKIQEQLEKEQIDQRNSILDGF